MSKLGIYLPTYKRPTKLQEVATNIEQNTYSPFTLYFGCEPEDTESIEAAKATGHKVVINKGAQGYSDTIQTIYEQAKEPIAFHANDDFYFPKDWDKACMEMLDENPEIMVLGAHDGYSNASYSTISFFRTKYIKEQFGVVDIPNRVFYHYNHNFSDTEFTLTAQMRKVWDKCEKPCIEHRRVGNDETYSKNELTYAKDNEIYYSRRHLFNG